MPECALLEESIDRVERTDLLRNGGHGELFQRLAVCACESLRSGFYGEWSFRGTPDLLLMVFRGSRGERPPVPEPVERIDRHLVRDNVSAVER